MASASVKSAMRVIEILTFFEKERAPCHQKYICEQLNYPQSSTSVILSTMTKMGYLYFDSATKLYFPTMRINSIGKWIPETLFGRGELIGMAKELRRLTGETIVIALRNDIYLQIILVEETSHPLRISVELGGMNFLSDSVLGIMLMSTFRERDVETIIRRSNIVKGLPSTSGIDAVMQDIRTARLQGYAYAENKPVTGGALLAVAVPHTIQGQAVGLGCCGTLERLRPHKQRYLTMMRNWVDNALGSSRTQVDLAS